MPPALAGTFWKLQQSPPRFGDASSFMNTVIFCAEYPPRFSRAEWNLADRLDGTASPSTSLSVLNPTGSYRELRLHKCHGFYGKRKSKQRGNRKRTSEVYNTAASRNDSAVSGDDASDRYHHELSTERWFNLQDLRITEPPLKEGRTFTASQAWDVLRHDIEFCSWKARQDVLAMKTLHDKVLP
jgi:hypothetical protein